MKAKKTIQRSRISEDTHWAKIVRKREKSYALLVKRVRQAEKEIKQGKVKPLKEVEKDLCMLSHEEVWKTRGCGKKGRLSS